MAKQSTNNLSQYIRRTPEELQHENKKLKLLTAEILYTASDLQSENEMLAEENQKLKDMVADILRSLGEEL